MKMLLFRFRYIELCIGGWLLLHHHEKYSNCKYDGTVNEFVLARDYFHSQWPCRKWRYDDKSRIFCTFMQFSLIRSAVSRIVYRTTEREIVKLYDVNRQVSIFLHSSTVSRTFRYFAFVMITCVHVRYYREYYDIIWSFWGFSMQFCG